MVLRRLNHALKVEYMLRSDKAFPVLNYFLSIIQLNSLLKENTMFLHIVHAKSTVNYYKQLSYLSEQQQNYY